MIQLLELVILDYLNTNQKYVRYVTHSIDKKEYSKAFLLQIRVDFVDTELLTPDNGNCNDQALTVSGTIWHSGINRICGINPGMYYVLYSW